MSEQNDNEQQQNLVANTTNEPANASQQQQIVNASVDAQQQQEAAAAQQPPTRLESFFAVTKSLILRALIIYFISSFFRNRSATPPIATTNDPSSNIGVGGGATTASKMPAWNFFENGTMFDLHAYISDDFDYVNFSNPDSLIWFQDGLMYGDWSSGQNRDGMYTYSTTLPCTETLQKNGSIFLHVYVTKFGMSPNPASGSSYCRHNYGYVRKLLNKFKKIRYVKTVNLLTGTTEKSDEEQIKAKQMSNEILSHWHPNLTINLVTDQTNWIRGTVPQPLDEFIQFDPSGTTYYPIIYLNDYWNMLRDYQPINSTVKTLELTLTFQPLSLFKWQLYAAQAMKNKWTSNMFGETFASATGGDESDEEQDSIKETLMDTNPYLLGLTILISILHSIFELLAFKNDIQFWNNRKSLEGLSVRSVFFAVVQSVIVLLYVLDNDTNFMIRISCFIGLAIEIWKIQKVVDVKFNLDDRLLGIIPKITFSDKGSYVESSTKIYDNLAFKYLGWLCFPLLIGYGIYSIIYNEHKGWYSFILNMLYSFLLTFGFIMMTPQLFINYKLKSVAHLPWRMMTYKFLNTFIDDIFAFVIKMPTMYRIGCFRDDIVFFIFLYQRYIYKVDHKRVNEFGFSGEMEDEAKLKLLPKEEQSNAAALTDDTSQPTDQFSAATTTSSSSASSRQTPSKSRKNKKQD